MVKLMVNGWSWSEDNLDVRERFVLSKAGEDMMLMDDGYWPAEAKLDWSRCGEQTIGMRNHPSDSGMP